MPDLAPTARGVQKIHGWLLAVAQTALPLRRVVQFYGAMAMLAWVLLVWTPGGHRAVLQVGEARWYAVAVGGALTLIVCSWLAERWWPAMRQLGSVLAQSLAPLTLPRIGVFALSSSVAEEALFRGPIHAMLGLWPTALLFGLSHGGLRPGMRVWAVFAVVAGALLGLLADASGSIWPGVVAHLLVNAVNMHRLRAYLRPPWA